MQCQRCYSISLDPTSRFCGQCTAALPLRNGPVQEAFPHNQPGTQGQQPQHEYHDRPHEQYHLYLSQPQPFTVLSQPRGSSQTYSKPAPPRAGYQNVNVPASREVWYSNFTSPMPPQAIYPNTSPTVRPEGWYENVGTTSASDATGPSVITTPMQQEQLATNHGLFEGMQDNLEDKEQQSMTETITTKDRKEETTSEPSGEKARPLPKPTPETQQLQQTQLRKHSQTHLRNEGVENTNQNVSKEASPMLGVNSGGPSCRSVLESSKPEMPAVPCGPRNQSTWPEDRWMITRHKIGAIRHKVFPNCRCLICKYPHPSKLHYTAIHMFEAWREKGSGARPCTKCQKSGHTAAECGLGEWRDLPDNPPIEDEHFEQYSQYLRPWPPGVNKVPFPICYYEPKYLRGSSEWPHLPPVYSKMGIPAGLVDAGAGIRFSLELLLWKNGKGPKPNYDPDIHKPYTWSANSGVRPGEMRRRSRKEACVTSEDTEKIDRLLTTIEKQQQTANEPNPPADEQQPTESVAEPAKEDFGCERSVGELQDPYLPMLVINGEKVDVGTLDHSKTTTEERKHPGLRPESQEEAQAHITYCVGFHKINMSAWKKVSFYNLWFLEEWLDVERVIHLALKQANKSDVSEGRLSKSESDTRFRSQCDIISDLGGSLLQRTKSHAEALEKLFEYLKGSSHTMEVFLTLERRLAKRWSVFDRDVSKDIDEAINSPKLGGQACEALKAWLNEYDLDSTFKKATGALLPHRSSGESVLALWLWPAAFQKAWIHRFHKGVPDLRLEQMVVTPNHPNKKRKQDGTFGWNKWSLHQTTPTRSVNKTK